MASALRLEKTKLYAKFVSTLANERKFDSISDLYGNKRIGFDCIIKGWVQKVRKQKQYIFVDINDGSCCDSVQVVIPRPIFPHDLSTGSSVCITGKLSEMPKGNIEIAANKLNVIGYCNVTDGYPFTPGQNHNFEYCRKYLHHRSRLPFFSSLLRVRQSTTLAVHKYFSDNNFIGVHTPILTCNDCEGSGETFLVRPYNKAFWDKIKKEENDNDEVFFNSKAFLTVSGQLHLEAITRSIPKVYAFNPVFRAENSKSRLHLSEFYMVEAEEGFIDGINDVLRTMETFVKSLISNLLLSHNDVNIILENNGVESKNHLSTLENLLSKTFTIMKYSEAKDITNRHKDAIKFEKILDDGLTKEEELFLVKYNDGVPILLVDFPKNLKPFYAKSSPDNETEVQAVDLLVPVVGELCGGSVREDDYDVLEGKLKEQGLSQNLNWYLQLRKFGSIPTGGFGMGFERLLQFALNIQNIKDTIPFPRWPHNLQL